MAYFINIARFLFLFVFVKNVYGMDILSNFLQTKDRYNQKISVIAERAKKESPEDSAQLKMGSYSDEIMNQINRVIEAVLDQKIDNQPIFPTTKTKIFALQNMNQFFSIENISNSKLQDANLFLKPVIYKLVMSKITELEKRVSPEARALMNKQETMYEKFKNNIENSVEKNNIKDLPKPIVTDLSDSVQIDLWLIYFKNRYNISQALRMHNLADVQSYIGSARQEYKNNSNATNALNSITFVLEAESPKAIEIEVHDLDSLIKKNEKIGQAGSEEYKEIVKGKFPDLELNQLQKPTMQAQLLEKYNKGKESKLNVWKKSWREKQQQINTEQKKSIFTHAYETFKTWWNKK